MRKLLIVSASVVTVFAGLALPAAASRRATASGTYTTSVVSKEVIRVADGVTVVKEVDTDVYAGDLIGAATDRYTLRVFANGSFTGEGTEVCHSCTLGGRTGGFTARFRFTGSGNNYTGTETFIRGTGGLRGLRGGGSFRGTASGNTYSYAYHFER